MTSLGLFTAGLNDRELVAAEPGRDVCLPQAAAQARRHGLEQLVAALVPERVVHALEFVEVEIEHRQLFAAPDPPERLLDLLAEENPVGQVRQRVEVRQMRYTLGRPLAFSDVLDHAQQKTRLAAAVADHDLPRDDRPHALAAGIERIFIEKHCPAGLQKLFVVLGDQIRGRLRKHLGWHLADDLFARDAEVLHRRLVGENIEPGARVPDDHRGRHVVDDLVQELAVAIPFLLDSFTLRDILDDADEKAGRAVGIADGVTFRGHDAPVAGDHHARMSALHHGRRRIERFGIGLFDQVGARLRNDFTQRLADRRFSREAPERLGRTIGEYELPFDGVLHHHHGRNVVENLVEELPLPFALLFELRLLGDVLEGRHPAAIRHRLIDDAEDPPIMRLSGLGVGPAGARIGKHFGKDRVGIAGITSRRMPPAEELEQGHTDEFAHRHAGDVGVALVAQHDLAVGIEHGKRLNHVVQGDIQLQLLLAKQASRLVLRL